MNWTLVGDWVVENMLAHADNSKCWLQLLKVSYSVNYITIFYCMGLQSLYCIIIVIIKGPVMLDACNGWPCCWHCQLASLACPGGHCQFVIILILIIQTFALLRWWDFNFQGHKWESDKKTVLVVIVAIMDFISIATYN